MPTTNFNAGIDSSDLVLSFGEEVTWGTKPAIQFQAIRAMSESLAETKTRNRPAEIEPNGYAAHGLTTAVEAGGDISFALSYATFDKFFQGMLNSSAWSTPLAIDGVAADITATITTNIYSSATPSKFINVVVGQWIKVFGFSNAANNGYHRVTAKAGNNLTITVAENLVTETPTGTLAKIRGSYIRNGTSFTSFYLQKKLATALFLNYAGAYITGGSVSASVGDFVQGSVSFLAKSEADFTADQSTGAVIASPTGPVIDTVAGIANLTMDDAAIAGAVQSLDFTLTKNNARAQYGIGSSAALGMGKGTVQVDGNLSVYFTTFTLYTAYKAEVDKVISFRALDSTGAGYIFTFPQCTLMNPAIQAGGPDTDVLANFAFEASQSATFGCTIQIDKMPATSA